MKNIRLALFSLSIGFCAFTLTGCNTTSNSGMGNQDQTDTAWISDNSGRIGTAWSSDTDSAWGVGSTMNGQFGE